MAIDTIKSTAVLDGSIATADIADANIPTAKIADDAVTADKLANAINTSIAAKSPLANPAFTGKVGIGTSSTIDLAGNASPSLTVSSNGPYICLKDANNADQVRYMANNGGEFQIGKVTDDGSTVKAEHMRITASGDIGFGTTTPDTKVQIKGGINSAQLILGGTDGRGLKVSTSNPGGQNDCGVNYDAQDNEGGGLGHHAFLVAGTERMRVCKTGTISLGKVNTPDTTILTTMGGNGTHHQHTWKMGPHYTADNPSFYTINESGTGVYLPHGNTAWSAHSDERIKENITPLGNVLSDVMDMRCVKYNLKSGDPSQTKIGFIAQDWQSSFPEVVDEDQNTVIESDGTIGPIEESESTDVVKAIAYTETIPVLLKAIQEQQALIVTLTTRITALEDA
jgi:hypothetical protein